MNSNETLPVETHLAVAALMARHAWLLDHDRSDAVPDLYCEDGRIVGVGADMNGRAAIAAWARERAAKRELRTRHANINIHITSASPTRIEATSIVILFRHEDQGMGNTMPTLVGDYDDIIVRRDGVWLFQERRVVAAFARQA